LLANLQRALFFSVASMAASLVHSFDVEAAKAGDDVAQSDSKTVVWASNADDDSDNAIGCVEGYRRFWTPKQALGAFLCPVLIVSLLVVEAAQLTSLTDQQARLLCVLCLVTNLWLCEVIPIPATAVMVGPLLVLLRVVPTWQMALSHYGHDLTFLIGGSLTIAAAAQYQSLDKLIAQSIKGLPGVRGNYLRIRAVVVISAAFCSVLFGPPPVTAMFVPILMEVVGAKPWEPLSDENAQMYLSGSLLSMFYACTASGFAAFWAPHIQVFLASLKGTSANGAVEFIPWAKLALPVSLMVVFAGFCVMYCFQPVRSMDSQQSEPDSSVTSERRLSWGQKVTACCCGFVMLLWLLPVFYSQLGLPGAEVVGSTLTGGCSAMLAATPLLFIPDADKGYKQAVMPWTEMIKSVDFGLIFVAGGGLALGAQLVETGLADVIGHWLVNSTGINDIYILILFATLFTTFVTELMSNLASISMLTPVILAAGLRITNGDVASALWPVFTIPMAACCSFMMPWAGPMSLMIINTGHVKTWNMMKYGLLMNLISALIIFTTVALIAPQLWPQHSFQSNLVSNALARSHSAVSSATMLSV
jgi:sodium-dependent dicarboxylate transporter 2/3/5